MVGAGIVGLAHALAAVRAGMSVVVIDLDARANGASVRNFGFVTVTGQQAAPRPGRLARRSRQVWREICGPAGIAIDHRGRAMVAQRPEALTVLEAFGGTDLADGCRWLSLTEAAERLGPVRPRSFTGALWSEVDLRVESRLAIPRLAAAWHRGAAAQGVDIRRGGRGSRGSGNRLDWIRLVAPFGPRRSWSVRAMISPPCFRRAWQVSRAAGCRCCALRPRDGDFPPR